MRLHSADETRGTPGRLIRGMQSRSGETGESGAAGEADEGAQGPQVEWRAPDPGSRVPKAAYP